MSSCWKENPLMRPAFSEIAQQLQNILREVKVINLKQAKLTKLYFMQFSYYV